MMIQFSFLATSSRGNLVFFYPTVYLPCCFDVRLLHTLFCTLCLFRVFDFCTLQTTWIVNENLHNVTFFCSSLHAYLYIFIFKEDWIFLETKVMAATPGAMKYLHFIVVEFELIQHTWDVLKSYTCHFRLLPLIWTTNQNSI